MTQTKVLNVYILKKKRGTYKMRGYPYTYVFFIHSRGYNPLALQM